MCAQSQITLTQRPIGPPRPRPNASQSLPGTFEILTRPSHASHEPCARLTTMPKWLRPPVVLLAALAVVATIAPQAEAARVPRLKHVWVFVLENHSYNEIIGNPDVPYLNHLARRHGVATRYYAVAHPSLPNYLAMISGSTHHCTSNGCAGNYRGRTLTGQFARRGLRWRGFIEALPHAGYIGRDSGNYTRHHNPFVYFRSIVQKPRQRQRITPFAGFRRSLRRPPALSYI